MSIAAADLKNAGIGFGVYYTEGADVYWLRQAEEAFRAIVSTDSLSLYEFNKLNSLDEIFTALETYSFSGESNVVIVKDSDFKPNERERKALKSLKTDDGYLLFINAGFLGAEEKKSFTAVNCERLDKFRCAIHAEKLFPYGIEKDALTRLVEYTDCDMARINLEAAKLLDYCGKRIVNAYDVTDAVVEDAELQVFTFVKHVVEGKNELAVRALNRLRKRGESPAFLLSSLIGQYRRMLHSGLSPKTDAELAALFKVKEYAVKKARSARTLGKKQLKNTVNMLVGYELKFKSGEMGEQTAFDAAISRLIGKEVV